MKINVLMITLVVILLGCKNNLNRDADYDQKLKLFKKELVDHFPRDGEYKSFSLQIDTSAYYNTFSIVATLRLSKERFNEILNANKSILIDNRDSNIIVVNPFLNRQNFPEPATVFCGEPCINRTTLNEPFYILPNFYLNEFQDSSTVTRLSNHFKHIVLEQKEGIYSNKIEMDKSSMPLTFFHGFTKGMSVNEYDSVVIYWTIIW